MTQHIYFHIFLLFFLVIEIAHQYIQLVWYKHGFPESLDSSGGHNPLNNTYTCHAIISVMSHPQRTKKSLVSGSNFRVVFKNSSPRLSIVRISDIAQCSVQYANACDRGFSNVFVLSTFVVNIYVAPPYHKDSMTTFKYAALAMYVCFPHLSSTCM